MQNQEHMSCLQQVCAYFEITAKYFTVYPLPSRVVLSLSWLATLFTHFTPSMNMNTLNTIYGHLC